MTKQTINYGAAGSGSGGDTARTALQKLEANFNEIFSTAGSAANAKALNEQAGAAGTFGVFTGAGQMRLASIIGAVAQSGGVPTGAIIERGSNANGNYVRYADGTQICWFRSTTSITTSQAVGALFTSPTDVAYTFPAQFVSSPIFIPSVTDNGGFCLGALVNGVNATGVNATRIYGVGSNTAGFFTYVAIGRWF